MGFAEYSNYDGLGLAELVKKKEIKPAELVEAAVERIERHNPKLNAVVFTAFDEASAMAKTSLSGPFAGVPMLLKDILGFKKGWPNRGGSRFVPALPSPFDSVRPLVSFRSAKPTCRSSAPCRSLSRGFTARHAIRGISVIRPAAPDRVPPWQPALCRSRTPMMAAVRSAYLPRAAASSASSQRAGAIR